ncbi:NADH-dependent FMN reductase RutF [Acinetobacter brisouii]|uniref:NADH-dependent FMN reductase RutF n=1 Tax=Acinetobacter brisouii TaxID=396323 RepID=UPI0035B144FA
MSILQPSSQTAAALNKMMTQAAENHVLKTATALNTAQQQFRNAMSNLAAAVNIVTTDGEAGRAGFTASAVCSVTDSPPTLLVCLNRNASVYPVFQSNQVLCVNTLAQQHTQLSNVFGGKTPMPERFAQGRWTSLSTGSPVLTDAVVAFDCKISQVVAIGTHDILFCEVQDLQLNHTGAQGLIYFDRAYHHLTRHQS